MRIALAGTGQMGQAIARLAGDFQCEVVVTFDSDTSVPEELDQPASLESVDVIIDFTTPQQALSHIERYCRWQLPAVVGTTGWYDDLPQVKSWVKEHGAALLYAPNFSLGVALMVRAIRGSLSLLNKLEEYDPYVHEVHHRRKLDSPSGTGLMLAEELLANIDRKHEISVETQHGKISPNVLHVSSTRVGDVFGEHTVGLDSPYDQVRIEHTAKNREGFAAGALRAAHWLRDRRGLFTLDELLADLEA